MAGLQAGGLLAAGLLALAAAPGPATAATAAGQPPAGGQAAPAARPTVVSLTFDDGDADQFVGARLLHAHGLRGTFYIITGAVGTPGYLTRAGLRELASYGDEIGGHTVSHLDLTRLSAAEARRQICAGRDILARWGYRTTSFAYPGAFYSRALAAIVRDCGFSNARIAAGLRSSGCPGCVRAETMPPAQRYAIRTPGQLDGRWTLAGLQRLVRAVARSGGGWLPLVFHHICAGPRCGPLSVRASLLDQFAAWLARERAAGVAVRTVGAVAGGGPRPLVPALPARAHGVVNPSLETVSPSAAVDPSLELAGVPGSFVNCWTPAGFGRSNPHWARTRDARTGRWALRLTVTGYASGDVKLLQQPDLGECSLPVNAGRSYQLSNWYRSTLRSQYAVYYRNAAGRWVYWRSSPYFPPSRGWARAVWQTPPLPAGATALIFGQSIAGNGTLTTDGYQFGPARPGLARSALRWVLAAEGAATAGALALAVARLIRRRPG